MIHARLAARLLGPAALAGATLCGACASLDGEAPALAVQGAPDAPISGSLHLTVYATDARPGLRALTWRLDDGPTADVPADGSLIVSLAGVADGAHKLQIVASDGAWGRNTTSAEIAFTVDQRPPALRVHEASLATAQGHVVAVWLDADEPLVAPRALLGARDEPMYAVEGVWRALFAVRYDEPPGEQPLTVVAADAAGNEARATYTLTVAETAWVRGGTIKLTRAQMAARTDEPALAIMREERGAAYALRTPEARWQGGFSRPAEGVLTSPFGAYRTYSDGGRRTHEGTDIARRRGVPVVAAALGRAVLARPQPIFGNAVIVDHGHGVLTTYSHLDELAVAEGAEVSTGDYLGPMGSTGQSTGPHLHWGLVVAGVTADALSWPEDGFAAPPAGAWRASPTPPP